MRLMCAIFIFAIASPLGAETIAITPAAPNSSQLVTIAIDGPSRFLPSLIYVATTSVTGSVIAIQGCYVLAFIDGGPYHITTTVGPLAPGTYSVTYAYATCDLNEVAKVTYVFLTPLTLLIPAITTTECPYKERISSWAARPMTVRSNCQSPTLMASCLSLPPR